MQCFKIVLCIMMLSQITYASEDMAPEPRLTQDELIADFKKSSIADVLAKTPSNFLTRVSGLLSVISPGLLQHTGHFQEEFGADVFQAAVEFRKHQRDPKALADLTLKEINEAPKVTDLIPLSEELYQEYVDRLEKNEQPVSKIVFFKQCLKSHERAAAACRALIQKYSGAI